MDASQSKLKQDPPALRDSATGRYTTVLFCSGMQLALVDVVRGHVRMLAWNAKLSAIFGSTQVVMFSGVQTELGIYLDVGNQLGTRRVSPIGGLFRPTSQTACLIVL
jgi:hypothetical protein